MRVYPHQIRRFRMTQTALVHRAAFATLLVVCWPAICIAQRAPAGADPRINERFYDPNVGEWAQRFEGESREIYARRHEIVAMSGAKAGMTVADVGAGSGFMALLFAKQVGEKVSGRA